MQKLYQKVTLSNGKKGYLPTIYGSRIPVFDTAQQAQNFSVMVSMMRLARMERKPESKEDGKE